MNPTDKRLAELLDKWLTSLELHLKYTALDEASYWKVQPWIKHDRPSRWIIELAKQKALALKEQLDSRSAMGDAKFGDALELMAFLTNLVGSQHIERFIPLAEPQNEVDLRSVSQTQAMPTAPATQEPTRESAVVTQPRETIRSRTDLTREMPRPVPEDPPPTPAPAPVSIPTRAPAPAPAPAPRAATRDSGRHAHPRADSRKAARRDGKHGHGAGARARTSPEKEKTVVADAIRLLGWGREWHELPDLIARMADRPPTAEIRRILRDHKSAIEKQLKTD